MEWVTGAFSWHSEAGILLLGLVVQSLGHESSEVLSIVDHAALSFGVSPAVGFAVMGYGVCPCSLSASHNTMGYGTPSSAP